MNLNLVLKLLIQSFRGAARLAYGQNADEVTEAPTTPKQKEVYENLSLPDVDDSATTKATKNGQRRSLKSDVSSRLLELLCFNFVFWK